MNAMASRITSLTIGGVTQPFIQAQMKENIKAPRHWPLWGESPVAGEFSAQRASNAENVSIWWRHHTFGRYRGISRTWVISNPLSAGTILVNPYHAQSYTQQWELTGKRLCLRDDFETVVAISGGADEAGCDVISEEDSGKAEQQWEFVHT